MPLIWSARESGRVSLDPGPEVQMNHDGVGPIFQTLPLEEANLEFWQHETVSVWCQIIVSIHSFRHHSDHCHNVLSVDKQLYTSKY